SPSPSPVAGWLGNTLLKFRDGQRRSRMLFGNAMPKLIILTPPMHRHGRTGNTMADQLECSARCPDALAGAIIAPIVKRYNS
ncbi:MAG: hypothetical protein K8963_01455, partial [Proteobacteria bacterium]|nr:hypothetical protein [Pseudomonadota bacterium]